MFLRSLISRYDNFKVELIPCNFYNDVTSTCVLCEISNYFYKLNYSHMISTQSNVKIMIIIGRFGYKTSTNGMRCTLIKHSNRN